MEASASEGEGVGVADRERLVGVTEGGGMEVMVADEDVGSEGCEGVEVVTGASGDDEVEREGEEEEGEVAIDDVVCELTTVEVLASCGEGVKGGVGEADDEGGGVGISSVSPSLTWRMA